MNSLALLALLATAPDRIPPVDQCSSEASFVAFRDGLSTAIARRDVRALLAALDADVMVDLGGGAGKEAFVEAFGLDQPEDSLVWDDLDRILKLGCAISGEARLMPAMVAQISPDVDLYETVVVVAPSAALHAKADPASEKIAELDWDVLAVLAWPDEGDFIKVRLKDGRNGWVRRDAVRSPLDRRITVERVGGKWKITSFVAGD